MKNQYFLSLITCFILFVNCVFATALPGFFNQFPNKYFVETGSFQGTGIYQALVAGFPEIHSIELSQSLYKRCKRKFKSNKNVHLWQGDSGEVLGKVIQSINEPITFWLDGHYSTGTAKGITNTPLLRELEAIANHPIKTHTIIIDDIRYFDDEVFDFIPLTDITQIIMNINKDYKISFYDGFTKDDILVAQVFE